MGLSRLYWRLLAKIFIILEFLFRKIIIFYLVACLKIIQLNKTKKKIIIIYNLNTCPVALGEIFDALMLARSLKCIGYKTYFYFTKDKLRKDYLINFNNKHELNQRFKDIKYLSKYLIGNNNFSFRKKKENQILKLYKKDNNLFIIKSINFFLLTTPIYKICHNLSFYIFSVMNKKQKIKFLLNKNTFKNHFKIKLNLKNYLSIGVRMALNNEKNRNLNYSEIIKFLIKNKLERKKIFIVSDKKSYLILKKNNFFKKKNIILSKKYNTDFVTDGHIILNSKKYYQLKGSGIQMFAEFSRLPYLIYHDYIDYTIQAKILRSDLYYNFKIKQKNPWSTYRQHFKDLNIHYT